ncbi:MAG TPA: AAA domain-containing protein [Actinoplanes sp.]|nr:AAA domain-containing protein [Actinoplanes sp.]
MRLAQCAGQSTLEPVPAAWPEVARSAIRALQHEFHHADKQRREHHAWLLREQSRRLQELVGGGPGFDPAAALAVGSPDAPRPPRAPAPFIGASAAHLDGDQRYAVGLGVTPGVTWLWGPPGTGKTATLSTLITQLAEKDLRVLLTAPTGAALDVTVNAVLKQSPALAGDALIRLGPDLGQESGPDLRQACRDARVVAALAHQVVQPALRGLTFDVVVLDEANMISAALAMLVAGAGSGHTVMAGDFRQLSPSAQAGTLDVLDWLHRSPFERAGIAQAVARGERPPGLAVLTGQHRMRDDIGRVVNRAFYPENPLRIAGTVSKRRRPRRAPWATSELLLLDTSGLRPRTTGSRYNVTHLQLNAALVGSGSAIRSLGLVTPFALQARLLGALLPENRGAAWSASTVHGFQGGERDVVVYDTVDTGYGIRNLHQWYTDGHDGSAGARLLNVAASRAREHLVIVGAMDSLHCWDTDRDAVWTFFEELEVRAEHLDWQDLLYDSPVTEHVTRNLIDRLRLDLRRAATVDMWLPRAELVNLPPLIRHLKAAPAGRATIWVEPDAHGGLPQQALQAWREGVNIRPLTPMPESFAVIGDVVWSAANALLGPAPGQILRTEHPALAAAIRHAQRRHSALAPGSGLPAQRCARCRRPLVRFETSIRGLPAIRHECHACARSATRRILR